jgi:hypothetical protein
MTVSWQPGTALLEAMPFLFLPASGEYFVTLSNPPIFLTITSC